MSHLEGLFGLKGKVALVTGASSGLGREAARALAKAGADVGLVARRKERLDEVAAELRALGVRAVAAPADVTDRSQLEAAFELVERELGPVDVAVHGAGIAPLGRAEAHARDRWDQCIALDLTASFEVSQLAARRMIARKHGGSIILISSVMGSLGNGVHRTVGYAAAKGGVNNLARQLAVEWARHGIRVNALAPSYFPTELTVDPKVGDIPDDQKTRMRQFSPMDRLGRAGELETAIIFLAAPGSSFVTGSVVAVDGGWSAW
jgi:NAD(P)-dependent dehydrogenase (short-subunit alcohol dehydrogenase family)